jgi:hypothetical protein
LRSFKHELTGVSPSIAAILETIAATPGIQRKELAGKVIATPSENSDMERLKLSLAADLKWLISAGYVIEFNDGSLDLPRIKNVAQASGLRSEPETANETLAPPSNASETLAPPS